MIRQKKLYSSNLSSTICSWFFWIADNFLPLECGTRWFIFAILIFPENILKQISRKLFSYLFLNGSFYISEDKKWEIMKDLQMVQNVQTIFHILEILIEIIDDAWKFTTKFVYTEWPDEKISIFAKIWSKFQNLLWAKIRQSWIWREKLSSV